jgi:DNA-binding NarL/FixJ family response regulator
VRRRSRPGTDCEQEVLRLVASRLPNKAISCRLAISEATIKARPTTMFQSIGVTERTQAALWAEHHGLA